MILKRRNYISSVKFVIMRVLVIGLLFILQFNIIFLKCKAFFFKYIIVLILDHPVQKFKKSLLEKIHKSSKLFQDSQDLIPIKTNFIKKKNHINSKIIKHDSLLNSKFKSLLKTKFTFDRNIKFNSYKSNPNYKPECTL